MPRNSKHSASVPLTSSAYLFKLLLIGNSGVGKSCILMRYAVRNLPPTRLLPFR